MVVGGVLQEAVLADYGAGAGFAGAEDQQGYSGVD